MKPIVIIGASGHAKVVIDIVERTKLYKIIGIVERGKPVGSEFFGYKIIGADADLPQILADTPVQGGVVAVGDNFQRGRVVQGIRELIPDFDFISAVHPFATIAKGVNFGIGTVVMAGVTINSSCVVGDFCIFNTHSSFDHDSQMASFASLAPGVITGGNVSIDEYSAIGIGASIKHGISIGAHSVIGAGSTVLTDIPDNQVAYGVPAKIIRARENGERYL